jgi:hypothetical protein
MTTHPHRTPAAATTQPLRRQLKKKRPTRHPRPIPSSGAGGDSVGTVKIGEETWNIVASGQCSMETVQNGLPVVSIAGHAESDESIEITLDFDPRDIGLVLTLTDAGGDPSWSANTDFAVQAGATHLSGEGTFSRGGEMVPGSFEAAC